MLFKRGQSAAPLRSVAGVNLQRYMGRWFEIARYPARFERECEKNTTAEYALRPNGSVRVENRCTRKDGSTMATVGTARIARGGDPARLKVKFSIFMPAGDYWIVELDPEYRWAAVGEPKRRFLWILSRTPSLSPQTYAEICERLRRQHYPPERLLRTQQDGA